MSRPKKPKSIEEAQKRIRDARYQLRFNMQSAMEARFDHRVAYRAVLPPAVPKEMVRSTQKEIDGLRRELSQRTHEQHRDTGQISLVCDLLSHSPIFLREKWVNDLILKRRRIVTCDADRTRRRAALDDLKAIARALLSEDLTWSGLGGKRKCLALSADRPRRTIFTAVGLQGRYGQYLEIGTCLLGGKELTREEWSLGGRLSTDPETLPKYAKMFGVPEDWIKTAWAKKPVRARDWALGQLVAEVGGTRNGVRKRLGDAEKLRRAELEAHRRATDAQQRLEGDRDSQPPDSLPPRRRSRRRR